MKKLVLLIAAVLMGTGSSFAASAEDKVASRSAFTFGNSFIFVENGITFSVYPDGEFDFYIDRFAGVNAGIAAGPVGITFNSGFDYNPFVQFDDYGAVVQVENVPVFYDYYGRVRRIGNIGIWYRNGLAYRIGGMRVFYNPRGLYTYHTGFINVFNRSYVFRPFHRFFARPAAGFCLVYNRPYRRFYRPLRYTYYGPYRHNVRRAYARIGRVHRYQPRAERARVYRNDRRVAARRGDFTYERRSEARRSPSVQERSNMRRTSWTKRSIASADRRNDARRSYREGTNRAQSTRISVRRNKEGQQVHRNSQARRSFGEQRMTRSSQAVKRSSRERAVQSRSVKSPQRSTRVNRERKSTVQKSRPVRNARSSRTVRKAREARPATARKTRGTTRNHSNARSRSGGRSNRSGRN